MNYARVFQQRKKNKFNCLGGKRKKKKTVFHSSIKEIPSNSSKFMFHTQKWLIICASIILFAQWFLNQTHRSIIVCVCVLMIPKKNFHDGEQTYLSNTNVCNVSARSQAINSNAASLILGHQLRSNCVRFRNCSATTSIASSVT